MIILNSSLEFYLLHTYVEKQGKVVTRKTFPQTKLTFLTFYGFLNSNMLDGFSEGFLLVKKNIQCEE